MKIIVDIFNEVITDEHLPLLFVFLLCAFALSIIEDVLGTIVGTMEDGFDLKKKLLGLAKRIAIGLTFMAFGFVVDFFVMTLNRLPSIQVDTQIVSVLEIVCVAVTWCVESSREIIEKLKSLKDLQYVSYDDVHYNDGNGISE